MVKAARTQVQLPATTKVAAQATWSSTVEPTYNNTENVIFIMIIAINRYDSVYLSADSWNKHVGYVTGKVY